MLDQLRVWVAVPSSDLPRSLEQILRVDGPLEQFHLGSSGLRRTATQGIGVMGFPERGDGVDPDRDAHRIDVGMLIAGARDGRQDESSAR